MCRNGCYRSRLAFLTFYSFYLLSGSPSFSSRVWKTYPSVAARLGRLKGNASHLQLILVAVWTEMLMCFFLWILIKLVFVYRSLIQSLVALFTDALVKLLSDQCYKWIRDNKMCAEWPVSYVVSLKFIHCLKCQKGCYCVQTNLSQYIQYTFILFLNAYIIHFTIYHHLKIANY